jgi:superfamily I DNA/RNA helicase
VAILAGPGSGKTEVMAERAAWLVGERKAHPATVLAFAFTRSAAAELRRRIATKIGPELARVAEVTTFHAWAVKMLRHDPAAVRLRPEFTVAREDEAAKAFESLYDGPIRLTAEIGRCRPEALREAVLKWETRGEWPSGNATAERLLSTWLHRLDDVGLVPLAALMPAVAKALTGSERVRAEAALYKHVLVDEAHDASPLELGLCEVLAPQTLTFVLDPRQAIFGWRGAAGADALKLVRAEGERHRLTRSYRFGPAIAAAANEVQPDFEPVEGSETTDVVREIEEWRWYPEAQQLMEAWGASNVAFLVRSRFEQGVITRVLGDAVAAPSAGSADPPAVRIAEAMARLALNRDDAAALRYLYDTEEPSLPWRPTFAAFAGRSGRKRTLAAEYDAELRETPGERETLVGRALRLPASATFSSLLEHAVRWCFPRAEGGTEKPVAEALARAGIAGDAELREAVDALAARKLEDGFAAIAAAGKAAVATVHAAKGREWKAVMIWTGSTWPPREWKSGRAHEERRVLFVALTRAQREVVIVRPNDGPRVLRCTERTETDENEARAAAIRRGRGEA